MSRLAAFCALTLLTLFGALPLCIASAHANGQVFPPVGCTQGPLQALGWNRNPNQDVVCLSIPTCETGYSLNFTGTDFACAPICGTGQSLILNGGTFSCCSPQPQQPTNVRPCPASRGGQVSGQIYDQLTINCDGSSTLSHVNTCTCTPTVQDINYRSCGNEDTGQVFDEITTNCDGTTMTATISQCYHGIVSTSQCQVGTVVQGVLHGGVLLTCSDPVHCYNYLCTDNGLVRQ